MSKDMDKAIINDIAEALAESDRWAVFLKEDTIAIAEHLESLGWITFRDEADAEANGWVRRGP